MKRTFIKFLSPRLALALGAAGALAPAVVRADEVDTLGGINTFLVNIQGILDILLPILVTLALLVFFWGLVKYLWSAGDEKARAAGKGLMIWGVIALFVMVSIWGLVAVIQTLFGVDPDAGIVVPGVDGNIGGGGGGGGGGSSNAGAVQGADLAPPPPPPPPEF